MRTSPSLMSRNLLAILLTAIVAVSCNEHDSLVEPLEDTKLIQPRAKECGNGNITVCGMGITEADAKINLGINARISCFGFCLGQDCTDKKKKEKCALKKIKGKGTVTKKIIPAEFPDDPDTIKLTATFQCQCKCDDCGGKKNVGNTFSYTSSDLNLARQMVQQMSNQWCIDFGCPGFDTCDDGQKCESTSSASGTIVRETFDPTTNTHTVTALLESCTCGCK